MSEATSRAVYAFVFLPLIALLGADPASQSPPTNPQAVPARPQGPTFRAGTTLVEVDAMVTDRNGNAVSDLTGGDFEVSEDGKAQAIELFYVVKDGRQVASGSAGEVVSGVPPAAPAGRVERNAFVFFFDIEHLAPGQVARAKQGALQFLESQFTPNDAAGVLAEGTLINHRLTNVRQELQSAVNGVTPTGELRAAEYEMSQEWPRLFSLFEASRIDANDSEMLARAVARAHADNQGTSSDDVEAAVQLKARRTVVSARASGTRTLQTLQWVIGNLARLPGRKTIVFLSTGFYAEEGWAEVSAVVGAAGRASVRIYAIDAKGLDRGTASSDILTAGPGTRPMGGEVQQFDTQIDGPNLLAVDSGGLMILNQNDVHTALSDIAHDTSSYYVLGYRPTNAAQDGTFRHLTVRVKRPGFSVRARKGYTASPALDVPAGR